MGDTTGTVTFLFTDIERSTERWQRDPDAMSSALQAHDEVLARVIAQYGGAVFKHTGDGVCAVFDSARQAAAAAASGQEQLELAVRMGLHTGEAERRDGDYFGPTLNRCSRIMDAGHGGQVLLSSVTRALLEDATVVDLGPHELKGIAGNEHIFQLGSGAFPPLRTRATTVRLPTISTSLIGRDSLIATVTDLVRAERVVTLTGVGGVGKTRVAVAVAERLVADHELVVFVDLAEVDDDTEILPALARALGVVTPTLDAVGLALQDRSSVIVLDNCEHVVGASADVVDELLGLTPDVRVLATSREGLAVDGERLVGVPPLSSRSGDGGRAATQLFVDRAAALSAEPLRDDDLPIVTEICRRLDGLPLAIELAASRVGVLGPRELLDRLDERFELLTGGRQRRSRDRVRTLRQTVDWSYDLLEPDERAAFAAFSVFAGSFALDGAAAVLGASEVEALDVVQALVDRSLLSTVEAGGMRRYRYLETIRAYAEERLSERGEHETAMERLHGHLVAVIRASVDDQFEGSGRGADRIRVEVPNLRRSFDHALGRDDPAAATELIAPLAELMAVVDWHISGWADEVLDRPGVAGSEIEPDLRALRIVDVWLDRRFDRIIAESDAVRPTLADAPEDRRRAREFALISAAGLIGDEETATKMQRERATRLAATHPGRALLSELFGMRHADGADELGAHERGVDPVLSARLAAASPMVRGWVHLTAAIDAYDRGALRAAMDEASAAMELNVEGSGGWFAALQLRAGILVRLGRTREAVELLDRDLDEAHRLGDRSAMIIPVLVYAMALRDVGEVDAVATLRGYLPRRMTMLMVDELRQLDPWLAERLPADRRHELAERGRAMSVRELERLARGALGPHVELAN